MISLLLGVTYIPIQHSGLAEESVSFDYWHYPCRSMRKYADAVKQSTQSIKLGPEHDAHTIMANDNIVMLLGEKCPIVDLITMGRAAEVQNLMWRVIAYAPLHRFFTTNEIKILPEFWIEKRIEYRDE